MRREPVPTFTGPLSDLPGTPRRAWSRLPAAWRGLDPMVVFSLVIIAAVLVAALVPNLLAPDDPYAVKLSDKLLPPSGEHLFGTDTFGRDVLTRVIYGARLSLAVGVGAVLIGGVIGGAMGVTAGYFGGPVKVLFMRLSDILLAFPGLLLALVLISVLGPSLVNLMLAVGLSDIPSYARVMRGRVLSVKERTFVQGAEAIGASNSRVIVRHIVPNAISSLVVLASANLGKAIVIGASLSFLGFGPQPPTAEWGVMLSEGRNELAAAWWIATFPGIALVLTVLALNILGDELRDRLDPKLATEA